MEETLRQVGELLLGAVPTVVLFGLLYVAYRYLLDQPLEKVLQERHRRTRGAMEKAQADIASADVRAADYEQRLRHARVAVYQAQESRRQKFEEESAKAMDELHAQARDMVRQARASLEQEMAAARLSLQGESQRLAAAVIQTVLKPASGPRAGGGA